MGFGFIPQPLFKLQEQIIIYHQSSLLEELSDEHQSSFDVVSVLHVSSELLEVSEEASVQLSSSNDEALAMFGQRSS